MPAALLSADINLLHLLSGSFGKEAAGKKQALLKEFSGRTIKTVAVARKYHEILLFLKAYPDNKEILQAAVSGLEQIHSFTKKIMAGQHYKMQQALSGTGMAGTLLVAQYSYPITKWLAGKFPVATSFHSAAGDDAAGAAILRHLLPQIEYYYATQQKYSLQKRLEYIAGKNNTLQNIIDIFEQSTAGEKAGELLFDQLKIYTAWVLNDPSFNRSFMSSIPQAFFYHKTLEKKNNMAAVLSQPCPKAERLSAAQKEYLLDVAKASLAFYYRETEPVTLASADEAEFFICSRGISIALYGMKPARRLSIESYIGYMVFKNNTPVAYGGGWMFGDRCKIGLNIYPPFRKGESALIFSEVLRLYHQRFHQQLFIVKPYQYGKGNKEGLQSAAFWFYYKLGFRPMDKKIERVAETEFNSNKKSSIAMLKFFTTSDLALQVTPLLTTDLDPENISRKITEMIVKNFNGNRQLAIRTCRTALEKILNIEPDKKPDLNYTTHFQHFSLLLSLLPNLANWNAKDKKLMLEIIACKANNEKRYIQKVQQHKRFIQELKAVF
ncbi:MAG: hypothetical protein IPP72_03120 [Chitinophagaceae bacterium]|nr:hypothetical protein [Chitinophagaceae bacterium]